MRSVYARNPERCELDKRGQPVSRSLPEAWQTVIVDRGAAFWLAGNTLMWTPQHTDDTFDWDAGGEVDFLGIDESDAAINARIRTYLLGVAE